MKQAIKVIQDIKVDLDAISRTKSQHLVNDRTKHIEKLKKVLKEYCEYKNINYIELTKQYNI